MARVHLIIQGPILSYFTSRFPASQGPDQVTLDGRLAYDCNGLILRMAREFRSYFANIVLSTWDNEAIRHRQELEALGVKIIQTPVSQIAHLTNPFKQVIGVLRGIESLKRNDTDPDDICVKIRTDLWADLPMLLQHVTAVDEHFQGWRKTGQRGYIYTLDSAGPFFLNDMIVAARADDFEHFWQAANSATPKLAQPEIHQALSVEYAWKYRDQLNIPDAWFLDFYKWKAPWHRSDEHLKQGRLWTYLLQHCFCFMPNIAPEALTYRGLPYNRMSVQNRLARSFYYREWLLVQKHGNEAVQRLTDLLHWESQRPTQLRRIFDRSRYALRMLAVIYHKSWIATLHDRIAMAARIIR